MYEQGEDDSRDQELKRERLEEEELEAEIDSLFSRAAGRNVWGGIFMLLGVIVGCGLFTHYYLHPIVDIISNIADVVGQAISQH